MIRPFIIVVFLFCSKLLGSEFLAIPYQIEKGDSFSSIIKKFSKKRKYIHANLEMIKKIRDENPHIKDWSQLPAGESITLYFSQEKLSSKKRTQYLAKAQKKIKPKKEYQLLRNISLGVFITASRGTIDEKISSAVNISAAQNSPFTLGLNGAININNSNQSISSSLYWSKLEGTNFTNSSSSVSVPDELGINIYHNFKFNTFVSELYYGLDYEFLSTFNGLEIVQNNAGIGANKHKILWATLGATRMFSFGIGNFFVKLSYSKSIKETTTNSAGLEITPTGGSKAIAYLSYSTGNRFSYHILAKKHDLAGQTEISIFRYGAGIGYKLF